MLVFFFVCSIFSAIVPPFQSPDEFEHIKRAYLFGHGEIVLRAFEGRSNGGAIDSGLLRYMEAYEEIAQHPDKKISTDSLREADSIRWEHAKQFTSVIGGAYYFPAIYAVHAFGLRLGEMLDLTLGASYRLTRMLLLAATCGVLLIAFRLFPPPPLVYALLIIPMSLFQFSSASLDGIATALSLLIISAFLRIQASGKGAAPWIFYLMLCAWMLVASSRLHLFSLLFMAIVVCFISRRKTHLIATVLAACFVILWQIIVMKTLVDGRVNLHATSAQIIAFYLQHPVSFLSLLFATATNHTIASGYFSSFFGMLGWLDAPFRGKEYLFLGALTVVIAGLSIGWRDLGKQHLTRLLLVSCAVASVFTIFFALLVTWTPHPATLILGVQGRYLLVPVALLAYATSGLSLRLPATQEKIAVIVTLLLGVYSCSITTGLLLDRYYLQMAAQ